MARKMKRDGGGLFDIESPMAIELRRIMIRLGRQLEPCGASWDWYAAWAYQDMSLDAPACIPVFDG